MIGYQSMGDSLKVQTDCSHDILIRRQSAVDRIGVVDDVTTEQKGSTDRVDEIHGLAERDENTNKTGHNYMVWASIEILFSRTYQAQSDPRTGKGPFRRNHATTCERFTRTRGDDIPLIARWKESNQRIPPEWSIYQRYMSMRYVKDRTSHTTPELQLCCWRTKSRFQGWKLRGGWKLSTTPDSKDGCGVSSTKTRG